MVPFGNFKGDYPLDKPMAPIGNITPYLAQSQHRCYRKGSCSAFGESDERPSIRELSIKRVTYKSVTTRSSKLYNIRHSDIKRAPTGSRPSVPMYPTNFEAGGGDVSTTALLSLIRLGRQVSSLAFSP
jgi:hypothetical protein